MLEKLRSGEALNAKEKQIHDQGLVTVLRQIHDELDQAVLEAYGWGDLKTQDYKTQDARRKKRGRERGKEHAQRGAFQSCVLPSSVSLEQELLTRLVALNHERAAEEKRGLIRYLRPAYQNPSAAAPPPVQTDLTGTETSDHSKSNIQNSTLPSWPDRLPEQVTLLRKLHTHTPPDPETGAAEHAERLSAHFGRKNKKRTDQIEGILETIKGLGQL